MHKYIYIKSAIRNPYTSSNYINIDSIVKISATPINNTCEIILINGSSIFINSTLDLLHELIPEFIILNDILLMHNRILINSNHIISINIQDSLFNNTAKLQLLNGTITISVDSLEKILSIIEVIE